MFGLSILSYLAIISNFVCFFLLCKIVWNSAYVFLTAILNLNFRLQASDFKFQRSEVPTELVYF